MARRTSRKRRQRYLIHQTIRLNDFVSDTGPNDWERIDARLSPLVRFSDFCQRIWYRECIRAIYSDMIRGRLEGPPCEIGCALAGQS